MLGLNLGLSLGLNLGSNLGAGGASFSPSDVAGLTAWYDPSDTATITEASGSVSQIDDKSGNDYHLVQVTGADQPITGTRTINSLNGLDFQGSQELTNSSFDTTFGQGDCTIFIVVQEDTASYGWPYIAGTRVGLSLLGTNSLRAVHNTAFTLNTLTITRDTNVHILGTTRSGTDHGAFIDGVVDTLDNTAVNVSTDFLRIGAENAGGGNGMDAIIGEALFYKGSVSDADKNLIGNYLADKWGVTWTDI